MQNRKPVSQQAVVVYRLGGEFHCSPASSITRVIRIPRSRDVMDRTNPLVLEGEPVLVVDLRERFGMEGKGPGRHIMVIRTRKGFLGLIVDEVESLMNVHSEDFVTSSRLLRNVEGLSGVLRFQGKTMMVTNLIGWADRIMSEDTRSEGAVAHRGSR